MCSDFGIGRAFKRQSGPLKGPIRCEMDECGGEFAIRRRLHQWGPFTGNFYNEFCRQTRFN
jgi:hypothetical protein